MTTGAVETSERGRRFRWRELTRHRLSACVAGLVAVLGVYWAAVAAWRSTFAIFGRDQGIFQYVSWAMSQGERVYVDFHEINGPLIHIIHWVFLRLGGADEHVFRLLDIALSSIVFLFVGALLPGIARTSRDEAREPTRLERALWALATWAVLTSQYVTYGWWQTAQRENLYDLFLLASMALELHALRPRTTAWDERHSRARRACFVVAGALSVVTFFGKPTCLLYTAVQALVIVVDRDGPLPRKSSLGAFAIGGALAALAMVAFIAIVGDLASYVRLVFIEVPRLYKHIWSRSIAECYVIYGNAPTLNYAIATLVPASVLLATGRIPRRFALVLSILASGLFVFFFQGKGFPYHLHPVTAGAHLVWLAVLAWAAEHAASARVRVHAIVVALAALVGGRAFFEASHSEAAQHRWDVAGATPELRSRAPYFEEFPWGDFFAWDLRRAAEYLRANTRPDARVQLYGMDPYLLFLAKRLSASPFIYSFELNVDAALAGGSRGRPSDADRAWLLATAARNDGEMVLALERHPPAAFAFIERSPFSYPDDVLVDFDAHCPRTAAFMHAHYRPSARFGAVHVWLPSDASAVTSTRAP